MPEGEGKPTWPLWVEEWVLPYLDDTILWPVLFSLLGHVVVVIVPLMLNVWRTGSVYAALLLAMLLGGTGYLMRMELHAVGRPGALSAVLLVMWLSSFPFVWFSLATGVL
jgi:hypothetical protein